MKYIHIWFKNGCSVKIKVPDIRYALRFLSIQGPGSEVDKVYYFKSEKKHSLIYSNGVLGSDLRDGYFDSEGFHEYI